MTTSPPNPNELLLIGQISGSFGLRGQVKMVAVTDQIEHLRRAIRTLYIGPKARPYQLRSLIAHKPGVLVLTLEGVDDRNAADLLRGSDVWIPESEAAPLNEGEYYLHSLYHLLVVTDTGEELGRVSEVIETGANDVIVVARPEGGEALLPLIQDVVREIDPTGGRIVVHLIDGLL